MWAGILASSSLAVAVPLSPFWGVLAERYSRKAIILRSLLVEAIAFALAAVCTDVWQFLGVKLLLGLSYGNIAILMATQSLVTPDRSVGTAVGIIQMASTIAMSVGPLFGSLIINTLGIRAMFGVDAALALSAALIIVFAFKEPAQRDRSTPLLSRLKVGLRQVAAVPPVRWNFLGWFLIYAGIAAIDPFLPVLIDQMAGGVDSATLIGTLLAGYGALTAIGTPIAGRLADRFGAERLFLVAAPSLALISFAIGTVSSLPILAALMLLRAVPQAGTAVVLYAHLARVVPSQNRAMVMSLTPMPRNSAWLVAPSLAAGVSAFGLSAVFWLGAGLFGAASVVAALMARASRPKS